MSRRGRALGLAALALLLGGLAATDVAGREAALRRQLGPGVAVLVARAAIAPGALIRARALAVRRVPERYAPAAAYASPHEVEGLRAAVAIPAGADLAPALLHDDSSSHGTLLGRGERIAQVVAVGPARMIAPGSRVDLLVTRDTASGGRTWIAVRAAPVLSVTGASAADGNPRVALTLRVSLRQAIDLAAAQTYARELRVLPRP